MQNLSNNAKILLSIIQKNNGSIWEDKAVDLLFNKPEYTREPEQATMVWQWEANCNLRTIDRPINGVNVLFTPNIEVSYLDQTYKAAKELKDANLINIPNKGWNVYAYETK